MSEMKYCEVYQVTDLVKFRSLGGEMWRRAVKNGLVKKNGRKKEEKSTKIKLSEAIKILARILYEREHVEYKEHIYSFDEILNNTKINVFKFDLTNCLVLASTSKEGLNTIANLGISMISRAALVLNVDNYHNIYTSQQPDITTIAINPKIVDDELITKHLNKRFIINLGVPYYDQRWDSQKVCSNNELIEN
ncbi:hypothetical protein C2G38_2209250 [Gigaspora rosea]|uniref:Uncharacterized protein n=1 Tax=Gigaspora rosea TaxID=44941 RepID=A0A397UJM0_9GLOM|nr:hypothetical protein C2G38_2209250 [Gigaspora rosea]